MSGAHTNMSLKPQCEMQSSPLPTLLLAWSGCRETWASSNTQGVHGSTLWQRGCKTCRPWEQGPDQALPTVHIQKTNVEAKESVRIWDKAGNSEVFPVRDYTPLCWLQTSRKQASCCFPSLRCLEIDDRSPACQFPVPFHHLSPFFTKGQAVVTTRSVIYKQYVIWSSLSWNRSLGGFRKYRHCLYLYKSKGNHFADLHNSFDL